MTDQQFIIDLGGDQRGIVEADDAGWLREKLRREPGSTRLRVRYDEDEIEGHRASVGVGVRVIAEDDDTEGHAVSIHFPSREEADAFRKRLLVTGVLAGTVALGAAGGIGLANMSSGGTGSAGAAQTSVTGSDWSQVERPPAAVQAVSGSAWTQDERPGAATGDSAGSTTEAPTPLGGPTPR